LDQDSIVVALNVTDQPRRFDLKGSGRILISTHLDEFHGKGAEGLIMLRANEGLVIKI